MCKADTFGFVSNRRFTWAKFICITLFPYVSFYTFHSCSVQNTIKFKGFIVEWGKLFHYSVYNVFKSFALFTSLLQSFFISELNNKMWHIHRSCYVFLVLCTLCFCSLYFCIVLINHLHLDPAHSCFFWSCRCHLCLFVFFKFWSGVTYFSENLVL